MSRMMRKLGSNGGRNGRLSGERRNSEKRDSATFCISLAG
jgi:hypothetical protein